MLDESYRRPVSRYLWSFSCLLKSETQLLDPVIPTHGHSSSESLTVWVLSSIGQYPMFVIHSLCKVTDVQCAQIGVEGLQTLKPQVQTSIDAVEFPASATREADMKKAGGVNVEARVVVSEDNIEDGLGNWMVENLKFSVEQPV